MEGERAAKIDVEKLPSYSKLVEMLRKGEMTEHFMNIFLDKVKRHAENHEDAEEMVQTFIKQVRETRQL